MTARCERFANQLAGRFGLPVARVDERYSSAAAGAGASIDARAAAVILQQWFDETACSNSTPRPSTARSPSACADLVGGRTVQLVGVHSGGMWLAERLREELQVHAPVGMLDVSFYRDDFGRAGLKPDVEPSQIGFEVERQRTS